MTEPQYMCQICRHPQRAEIEQAMVGGKSLRSVASQYNLGSYQAVFHHKDHLSQDLVSAIQETEKLRPQELLDLMRHMVGATTDMFDEAKAAGNLGQANRSSMEVARHLDLFSRASGVIKPVPEVGSSVADRLLAKLLPEAFGDEPVTERSENHEGRN